LLGRKRTCIAITEPEYVAPCSTTLGHTRSTC
jgi:hypothetical protein